MNSKEELIKRAERSIRHAFDNKHYLVEALTHASYSNEENLSYSNERFELLGDAVYHLIITEHLIHKYMYAEGQLSAIRAHCESESFLYKAALDLRLGEYIYLGRGEENAGGRFKESILSDCYEAVIAAIYLDSGWHNTRRLVLEHLSERFSSVHDDLLYLDSKSELQKYAQQIKNQLPQYTVIEEKGPEHEKAFTVSVSLETVDGKILSSQGFGQNKRAAEKDAARNALLILTKK